MKKVIIIIWILICAFSINCYAQKETFDLFTYTPPEGWDMEMKEGVVSYTFINKKDKSWCQMGIFKSTTSKGNLAEDFNNEWENLVVKQYQTTEPPSGTDTSDAEGWKIKSGAGKFIFNNKEAAVILTTFSGFGVCMSAIIATSNQRYFKDFEDLIGSVELKQPEIIPSSNEVLATNSNTNNSITVFTTTNFDDGWTSTIQENWVEVTKGEIKVLLHYPKEGTFFPADPDPLTRAAWDILVAPRYSNLKNFKTTYITTYERPYIGYGKATENNSGKEVFIVLFRQGNSGWIELIAPDKTSFIEMFRVDPEIIQWDSNTDLMKPMVAMGSYNKFAIATTDFTGTWSTKFSNSTYYTNIYTGNSAGMSTYSSSQTFVFTGSSYKWNLVAANTYGGHSEFGQGKGNGTFKVLNNWQIYFSEMEGKPKTYDAYFSAVKGGRVLWINDAQYPGSGIFTGFSKQ